MTEDSSDNDQGNNDEESNDNRLTDNERKELRITSRLRDEEAVKTKTPEGDELVLKESPDGVSNRISRGMREEEDMDESHLDNNNDLKIEEKVRGLPDRIERLFEDVRLLNEVGHLKQRAWWRVTRNAGEEEHDSLVPPPAKEREFGRTVGKFCRNLSFSGTLREKELIRGFVEGLVGKDDVSKTLDELSTDAWRRELEDASWSRSELADAISSLFEYEVRDNFSQAPEYVAHELKKSLKEDDLDEELADELLSYVRSEDEDTDWSVSGERIHEYLRRRNMGARLRARKAVNDDLARMSSRDDVLPIRILLAIPEDDDGRTALSQISERVNERIDDDLKLSTVARICLYMENSRSYPETDDTRENPAILTVSDEEDMPDWEVSLTPYGRLLRENIDQSVLEMTEEHNRVETEDYLLVFDPFEEVGEETMEDVIEEFS